MLVDVAGLAAVTAVVAAGAADKKAPDSGEALRVSP